MKHLLIWLLLASIAHGAEIRPISTGGGGGSGDVVAANNLSDLASAPAALTNLGGTTSGVNLFKLTNPGAVTFLRINADNTVTARSAANFITDLGIVGVTDGDKGDITVSATGTAWTVDNDAVTLAKLANMATASFLGRNTAGTGDPEALSVATAKTMLNLTGTNSGDQTITLTGNVTGSGTGSFATTISNSAVTLAKMDDMATASFLGRVTGGTGPPEVLNQGAARLVLGVTTVGGNILSVANPGAVTYLRINADNTVTALSAADLITALGIPTLSGNNTFTGNNTFGALTSPLVLDGGATPTVDAFGEISTDNNFFAASKGAIIWWDGTGVRVVPAYTNAVPPTDGQVLSWDDTNKWWEPATASGGGSLTSTRVGYGDGSNLLTGEAAFTYTAASNTVGVDAIQLGATGVTIAQDADGAITFTGTSAGADEDLTINLDDTANFIVLTTSTGATLDGSQIPFKIGRLTDDVDETTPLHNIVQTVAAGTAYTLTTTYANVDFGTTDPVIVIPNAGTYMVYALFDTTLVSATSTTQVVQGKVRRTNNTAADLGFASAELLPPGVAASIAGVTVFMVGGKYTTTNTDDSITIQAQISAALGAGTVTVTNARIWAERAY